jgi:hypothetical protein
MWSRFKISFIDDINLIFHDKRFLAGSLIPVVFIASLKLIFPLISHFFFNIAGFQFDNYYSVVAITLVSCLSMIIGKTYGYLLYKVGNFNFLFENAADKIEKCRFLIIRMIIITLYSFILEMITIILIKPVPTEGWLRTLFAAILLATQSAFIFVIIINLAEEKSKRLALSGLFCIFLITVPFGLLLHHPLNYFTFFSPLYWIAWAWVVKAPVESMIYGAIALIITSGTIVIFLCRFLKKHGY